MSTMITEYEAGTYEKIVLNGTAKSFTQVKYKPTSGDYAGMTARKALVVVDGGSVRVLETGDTPTAEEGVPLQDSVHILVEGEHNIQNFKAINEIGEVVLWVTYYFPVLKVLA